MFIKFTTIFTLLFNIYISNKDIYKKINTFTSCIIYYADIYIKIYTFTSYIIYIYIYYKY